jgi:cell division protein FtsN
MPRPSRQHAAPRRRSGGGFLLGAFIGLIIGLAIAVGVAFYLNKTPIPFLGKAKPAAKDAGAEARPPAIAGMPQGGSKPGAEKPRFDFYKILPGGEETVTDRQLKDAAKAAKAQPNLPKDVYYIQAGSFQNPADADNQKARLAILGLESSVEPTTLPDKGTWYRVRLGPYTRLEDLNRVRQQLTQNGIDASLVKLKDPAVRTN